MLPDGVKSWVRQQPSSSSTMEIVRRLFLVLGLFYKFLRHCMSQLQRGYCFLIETHTILLKSCILKTSWLILQILVMSLSSFICRNLKRRSFTVSSFEINMSMRIIEYCSFINFYVCLGCYKLCFSSVSSIVFFQLIWWFQKGGGH